MKSKELDDTLTGLEGKREIDELVYIWLEASKKAHQFIDYSYWLKHAETMKNVFIPQSETWIYKENGVKTVGFVSLVENCLAAIFIHPDYQHKGIGHKLIEKAKQRTNELSLCVYVKNKNAVQFYERNDFVINGKRTDEGTGEEEYLMSWAKKT